MKQWGTNGTVHPDDLPRVVEVFIRRELRRAIHTKSMHVSVVSTASIDGFRFAGFRFEISGGAHRPLVLLLIDIDDRKRAEAELERTEGSALQRESGAAGRGGSDLDVRGDRRDVAGASAGARPRGQGRPDRFHRADHRGDRHGQRTRRARDPSAVGTCLAGVRERQLRRRSARTNRLGALRPREGGVHRGDAAASRSLRAGARRDHLPR